MEVNQQHYSIVQCTDNLESVIEYCGRTCYKSEPAGCPQDFIRKLRRLGHHSVLEHGAITVRFTTDRAVTHELVRHRLASYSQESQRYCAYRTHLRYIAQWWMTDRVFGKWATPRQILAEGFTDSEKVCLYAWLDDERFYHDLLKAGSPQVARTVLSNGVETTIQVTANPREWRHILGLRCGKGVYPQMRALMLPLLRDFAERWPALYEDLKEKFDE